MVATCGQARVASTSYIIQFPMARGKKAETAGVEWKPRGYNRVAFYPGNDSNQAPVVIEQEVKGTVVRKFLHGREDKKYGYGTTRMSPNALMRMSKITLYIKTK